MRVAGLLVAGLVAVAAVNQHDVNLLEKGMDELSARSEYKAKQMAAAEEAVKNKNKNKLSFVQSQTLQPSTEVPRTEEKVSLVEGLKDFKAILESDPEWKPGLSNHEIQHLNPGTYEQCDGPMLWLIMGGHFRTGDQHLGNTRSFLQQSNPCHFAVYILRPYIAEDSTSWNKHFSADSEEGRMWKAVPVQENAEFAVKNLLSKNTAYVIYQNKERQSWAHLDTLDAGRGIVKALQEFHGIKSHDKDVVVLTRPDVIFNHAIQFQPLTELPKRFWASIPHESSNPGSGNDPSEVMWVASKSLWEDPGCGNPMHMEPHMKCDALTYYMRPDFGVYMHRLGEQPGHARGGTPLNNPVGDPMDTSNAGEPMDITKNVVLGFPNDDAPPESVAKKDTHKVVVDRQDLELAPPVPEELQAPADPAPASEAAAEATDPSKDPAVTLPAVEVLRILSV